jgi:hypothetical protein
MDATILNALTQGLLLFLLPLLLLAIAAQGVGTESRSGFTDGRIDTQTPDL